MPIVNGFSIAPANPNPAATKTMQTPVMEFIPHRDSHRDKHQAKCDGLFTHPKTAPNMLNSSMMDVSKKFSSDLAQETVVLHFAGAAEETDGFRYRKPLLSLTIQNAPPIIRMKTMISALSTNPLQKSREHLPSLRNMFYRFVDNRFFSGGIDTLFVLSAPE